MTGSGLQDCKFDPPHLGESIKYDAENRLTLIDFPSDTDISYSYDSCVNGKGRLCSVTDQAGSSSYEYTVKGQLAKETKNLLGVNYVTQYGYDMNGNLTSIVYPGGRSVTYGYNYAANRVSSVQQNGGNVASGIAYEPFGGLKSLTYGNGLTRSVGYDSQYRLSTLQTGGVQNLTYGFDGNGNITAITDNLNGGNSKTYGYDALDRLSSAAGPWGSIGWSYDPVGNRLTQTDSSGTATYNYQSGSNRISGISGAENTSYSLDANGNATAASGSGYTYNQNQRLIHAAAAQSADYLYNAQGQRAIKTVGGQVTVYHYDQAGHLLAETDANGTVQVDYLHLDGQPLAKIDATGTSYIHPDHLGTPQLMTDSQGAVVWQIQARPFGDSPTITGTQTLNLRFPGQYYDAESGLHQNWFRDYQPNLGRYVEADPIGLRGGDLNLFGYAKNNPVYYYDLVGKNSEAIRWGMWGTITIGAILTTIPEPSTTAIGLTMLGGVALTIAGDTPRCNEKCPPCEPYPVGTLGYQGPEVHSRGRYAGKSHYHLFIVEQIPSTCQCIWKEATTRVAGDHAIADQPDIFYTINKNEPNRPPSYP
jgi:RHS repeat-associated protein